MRISPFTLSPNPAWMYLTPSTLASIESVRAMIDDGQGLAAIFGEPGMGKSSLLRYLHSEYADETKYRTGFLTRVDFSSPFAFTKRISDEFEIEPRRSLAVQNSVLEDFLLAEHEAGRTVVLFLDEGQSLDWELLEVIRNLLNFETNVRKLIQVVVAGQVELLERIRAKRNMKALASRIFSPVMIEPLDESETVDMVKFRCERARVPCPFSDEALRMIHAKGRGVPREILKLCAHAVRQFPELIQPSDIDAVLERGARAAV
jgi:general secretion pathway protein A